MERLTQDGHARVAEIAKRNGFSADAAEHLLGAIVRSRGTQAQFNHPDLGGMGQWSKGGMIMVGDMFNQTLKQRVAALCTQLAELVNDGASLAPEPAARDRREPATSRWPAELGTPSSSGSQNDLHYAVFPETRRLAIERHGRITVYDTGDHRIHGFSQHQSGHQSLSFTSQSGPVRLADLQIVSGTDDAGPERNHAEPPAPRPSGAAGRPDAGTQDRTRHDPFTSLERLAALREKGVITADEFNAKKAELLARL